MRQYVLTRSAFNPACWDIHANHRRLCVTRAVTARLLASQTITDWTWVVLLDERDPLLQERLRIYRDAAPHFRPIIWQPAPLPVRAGVARQRAAFADYRAPWRQAVGPADDLVLMARLDDDDGFAPDALARFRAAAAGLTERTILMLPSGIWTHRGRAARVTHKSNAMHTLVTPPGDCATVYDYSHTKAAAFAPIKVVDTRLAWLWVRHHDTISQARNPRHWGGPPRPLERAVMAAFPIDWTALVRALP